MDRKKFARTIASPVAVIIEERNMSGFPDMHLRDTMPLVNVLSVNPHDLSAPEMPQIVSRVIDNWELRLNKKMR
jgi:hypothetical protein